MEALNMLKFWRISTALDEEDSFFDCPKYIHTTAFFRSPPKFPVLMLFKKSKCGEDRRRKSKSSKVKCELGEEEENEKIRISSILQAQGIRESPKKKKKKKNRFVLGGKDVVSRYVKLIKPLLLYVKVSRRRRQGERVKLFPEVNTTTTAVAFRSPPPRRKSADEKHVDRASKQYLRKSRSASSVRDQTRRDDTLMEQNEGIQAAILHCKRSYTR